MTLNKQILLEDLGLEKEEDMEEHDDVFYIPPKKPTPVQRFATYLIWGDTGDWIDPSVR